MVSKDWDWSKGIPPMSEEEMTRIGRMSLEVMAPKLANAIMGCPKDRNAPLFRRILDAGLDSLFQEGYALGDMALD